MLMANVTGGGGGITLVSKVLGPATPGSGGGAANAINTTGANFLVAVVASLGSTITDSVTGCGSPCNTWTALTSYGISPQNRIYYAQNPTVGTNHIITCSGGGTYPAFSVYAFSGMLTSGVFDSGTDSGATGTSTIIQPGSITPSSGHRLLISSLGENTPGTTVTVDSSFSTPDLLGAGGGTNYGLATSYLIQTTGTTVNPTWTLSSVDGLVSNIAAFKGI
jgi:hypothetical protein